MAARPVGTDLVADIGLWGTSPAADLDAARTQLAAGDAAAAAISAGNAASAWSNATDIGQGRLVSLGLAIIAVLFAFVLLALWYRGRRRARRGTMTAGDIGA